MSPTYHLSFNLLLLQAFSHADTISCAAKYKSVKALRDETELFDQLSNARVYTTNDISTSLVLMLGSSTIRLRSDRPVLHDEFFENQLKLYVPHNTSQQAACYRSQLPNFMARFLGVTGGATHPISLILSSNLSVLEDILFEQDIPPVEWIEQPRIERPTPSEDDRSTTAAPTPRSPASHYDGSVTLPMPPTPTRAPFTPETNADRDGRYSPPSPADDTRVPGRGAPHQYERFIEQVVQSAQRARYRQVRPYTNVAPAQDSPPADDTLLYNFNHIATFGTRDVDTMGHDRRIGAAGEAYVSLWFQRSLHLARSLTSIFPSGFRISLPPQLAGIQSGELAEYHPWRTPWAFTV